MCPNINKALDVFHGWEKIQVLTKNPDFGNTKNTPFRIPDKIS
jgi:hypothetical protein